MMTLKDEARTEMQELRIQVAERSRVITDLDKRIERLQAEEDVITKRYETAFGKTGANKEKLQAKIDEVKKDLADMIKFNSTSTKDFHEIVE